jgi:hypothetical protein
MTPRPLHRRSIPLYGSHCSARTIRPGTSNRAIANPSELVADGGSLTHDDSGNGVILSPLAMPRPLRRLVFSLIGVTAVVLLVSVAIAKAISIIDTPHDGAAFLESVLGTYWPVIVVADALISIGIAVYPQRRA